MTDQSNPTMTVHEAIAAGRYENRVPFAWTKIPKHDDMTIRQAREHDEEQERLRREQRLKHHEEQGRLTALLKGDLEREHGIVGNPKADLLWEMAWERGHSNGYPEVCSCYENLVELVK